MTSRASAYHEAAHAVATVLCGEYVYSIRAYRTARTVRDRRGRRTEPVLGLLESSLSNYPAAMRLSMLEGVKSMRLDPDEPADFTDRFARGQWCNAINNVFVSGAGAVGEARASKRSLFAVQIGRSVSGDYQNAMEALVPFMEPEEAEQYVWAIWSRAAARVGRGAPWRAVAAVADAMVSKGRLSGDRAMALIERELGELPAYSGGLVPVVDFPMPGDIRARFLPARYPKAS